MNSRERVLTAMQHKEPDRVPLFYRDVPEVEKRLLDELGLKDRDALMDYLGIDFRRVGPTYIGPALEDTGLGRRRDIWDAEYEYVRFSETAGYWEIVSHPLTDCHDPARLDDYCWPSLDWFDFSTLKDQVAKYDEFAILTTANFSSPGVLQTPIQKLIGDERSLIDIALHPDFFDALVERIMEFQLPFIDRMLEAAGGRIDFFRIGDDFGTQRGLLIGLDMWRERIQPAFKAMIEVATNHNAYCYLHSCGSVRELIPAFIETGVDVLDPVQVKAAGMEPKSLKEQFGEEICFCGGVDEQDLLPNGSAQDVRDGVVQLLDDMARGGGFFIGPTHNFQDDIPTENIIAMYEAAREWSY